MVKNYLKPAWRSLSRNPQVTVLNIAGLTGILRITRLNIHSRPIFAIGDRLQYEKNCAYVDPNWFASI